jgi:transcriptional regulator with GAF, ATPase, and Fis domain
MQARMILARAVDTRDRVPPRNSPREIFIRGVSPSTQPRPDVPAPPSLRLRDVVRDHILHVLTRTGWVIEGPHGAAALLDLKPSTLRYRMRVLGIRKPPKVESLAESAMPRRTPGPERT